MNSSNFPNLQTCTVVIIGLGYVGLPLATEIGKTKVCLLTKQKLDRKTIGFDVNQNRINQLKAGLDINNELTKEELEFAFNLEFTDEINRINIGDVYIVTVPTPIKEHTKEPNLDPLNNACKTIGIALSKRDSNIKPIIIFESTVYPGATEEVCVPIIEKYSKLSFNKDFYCGYSPERINPGDKKHKIRNIIKITSGSTKETAKWVDDFYGSIIQAGTYSASSLKVAEAAKVIENTQRDLNIALVNEFSIIFKNMGLDTLDILEAAKTKWNFIDFKPGLVGGHCISIDPYYLTYKSLKVGYEPEMVLAGRKINDNYHLWITNNLIFEMVHRGIQIKNSKVLILGFTFKENCPDLRNTRVLCLDQSLKKFDIKTTIIDPIINLEECKKFNNINIKNVLDIKNKFDAVILAVAHKEFKSISIDKWSEFINDNGILFDLKGIIPRELNPIRI